MRGDLGMGLLLCLIRIAARLRIINFKIFISYRRADSEYITDRVYERLARAFGPGNVVRDIDSIPHGIDFRVYISDIVERCAVLVAVIGDHWLAATDERGTRRLDDPTDFV